MDKRRFEIEEPLQFDIQKGDLISFDSEYDEEELVKFTNIRVTKKGDLPNGVAMNSIKKEDTGTLFLQEMGTFSVTF